MTVEGLRTGQVYGVPVSRNPAAWIPFFIIGLIGAVLLPLIYLLFMAVILAIVGFKVTSEMLGFGMGRYQFTYSDAGVRFRRGYRRLLIPWDQVREVVDDCESTEDFCYRIISDLPGAPAEGFLALPKGRDYDEFEKALAARNIPVRRFEDEQPE
jgi:hypothetical protein